MLKSKRQLGRQIYSFLYFLVIMFIRGSVFPITSLLTIQDQLFMKRRNSANNVQQ